jgi:quercetin 2,3-dioxygenase
MITIRSSQDRGHADFGWLQSQHTFSFGQYIDPTQMGFASLRVINEDRVTPGKGFGTHSHTDMEIVTYVLEGALEHKDSLGTGSIIYPGDVQRMSAGTGIQHSEFNASQADMVHFLQIWILPGEKGITPSYEQKTFSTEDKTDRWRLVASPTGREGSVTIHQDIDIYGTILQNGSRLNHSLANGRVAWLQVATGSVKLNDRVLQEGDGAAITQEDAIEIQGTAQQAELLLFDMAAS